MYSWKDKLIDWANQKGAWTHILVAVGITILITAIILGAAMPSKGVVDANKVDIGQVKTTMGIVVDGLATKASQSELDDFSGNVTDVLDDQAGDISGLGTRMDDTETGLGTVQADIVTIQGGLAELSCTPPEAYLTGTFGNYTLHAKSNEAGNFTADVHLLYSPPLWVDGGNATIEEALAELSGCLGWVSPVVSYNGTIWGVTGVQFNIGTFELAAKTEKAIDITCVGLNSTWGPSYAYVEVWPVIQ